MLEVELMKLWMSLMLIILNNVNATLRINNDYLSLFFFL